MEKVKRGRGRPPLAGEPGQRYQVHLPRSVADKLRAYGDNSLSQGIIKASKRVPLIPQPPLLTRDLTLGPQTRGQKRTR